MLKTFKELSDSLSVEESTEGKCLKLIQLIHKLGNWQLSVCKLLFQRYKRKSYLPRIVNSDKKWFHYGNSKRKKSWVKSHQW